MALNNIKKSVSNSVSNTIGKFTPSSSSKKSQVLRQIRQPLNRSSKIREIIYWLCENKEQFENFNFLILLSDDYFKKKLKIFPSRKNYIQKLKLPGKLLIEKYSDLKYNINKYSFESNPIPNQIYIKLQKEQVYVLYSEYEYKLLESQFNEFYDIIAVLGAKYIKMSKLIKNNHGTNIDVGTEIGLSTVCKSAQIKNKVSLKDERDTSLLLTQEMHFNNDNDPELSKLINNNYYYLPNQIDLQNLIIRRIENNQVKDKYTFIYSEKNLISRKILTKLNKLNIGNSLSFDYTSTRLSNFQIEYIIEFNNIKNKKLNNNLTIEEEETSWLYRTVSYFISTFLE